MNYEQRLKVAAEIVLSSDRCVNEAEPLNCAEFGVTASMKPHQTEGVSWLIRRYMLGVNVILGDEMGLGKTLQAITFLSYLKFHQKLPGPFLVLCPLSVTDGWISEINKFSPKLKVLRYVADKEHRRALRRTLFIHVNQQAIPSDVGLSLPFEVLLTTYDVALMDQDFLCQIPWHYAVIDEAQRLKNSSSINHLDSLVIEAPASTILKLHDCTYCIQNLLIDTPDMIFLLFLAPEPVKGVEYQVLYNVLKERFVMPRRLLMTGTPIQNNLSEFWALMHFCMPSVFGTLEQFLSTFKEAGNPLAGQDAAEVKKLFKILKYVSGAFMLRRTKSMLVESGSLVLPPLTEIIVMAPLVSLQKKVYASILRRELPKLLAVHSGASNVQSLQNIVIQLRKACSHPYLFPGIEPEPYEEGEHLVQASGKLIVLDQLLKRLHETGHRVLLFAQMTQTLDILQDFLELRNYSYERLDGSVRAEERFAAIRSFSQHNIDSQSDQHGAFVFMISTRAGGVGLNLVAADTVIFYEQDWNPQVDRQALQRAHRIGQMNHVMAINLITRCTVEEVIMRRAERKLQLSHNVIGEANTDENAKQEGADAVDLRSAIFGLHMFDPTDMNDEKSSEANMSVLNDLAEKVIAMRHEVSHKVDSKFEINPKEILNGDDALMKSGSAFINFDPGLEEASYNSWVEKFKEVSQSADSSTLELISKRSLPEERYLKHEKARKDAEDKKLSKWEALGYQSLAVKNPISPVDGDLMSDSGSMQFVYGDCTCPSKICPAEPSVIFSCVDNSGNWGRGGMFDALAKLSASIPDAYQRAYEFGDLHLGDLHLIKINEDHDERSMDRSYPLWVALAVVQSYNPRRKVPRSNISIPDLEQCLMKASFSAAQNSASIHMPRIGYQDGSNRSEWYTVERLLRKYASIYAIKIFVYYFRRPT